MAKTLKILLIIAAVPLVLALAALITYYSVTAGARLDHSKLINYGQSITLYDDEGNEIDSASLSGKRKSVLLSDLKPNTVNAFIASEDRNFYSHNGLNYKRMLKALYTNLTTRSFKEGASTISQQLIKNTHLSNDKTLTRKLKEIRLTKQLEKKYDKDSILEMYLNTIYFGHNCYGLQSAADFYFGKSAENLTLTDSATLVGLLISPNNYSPFKHPEKCVTRRNVVLKNMLDCNFISSDEYEAAKNAPLEIKENQGGTRYADYYYEVFEELAQIYGDYPFNPNCGKIYTNLNRKMQNYIENLQFDCDNSIVINDNRGKIIAYKSTIGGARRQPGSTIKPILVYAPAIEEKKIHAFTKINDEKIDFNGYSPKNYDGKYRGRVTVAESISKSLNVPAVKTLNSLTLPVAEKYAAAMNINLDDDEKNLSLALGGMKNGLNLKEICEKYSIFAAGGVYTPTKFIKEIRDENGKTVYKAEQTKNNVFSDGTCSLINEMLIETANSGTAKKLKSLPFTVAAKTGTCGNEDGNTDAYAIAYTAENCVGVWLGDKNNERKQITGGKDCCNAIKDALSALYEEKRPAAPETEKGTKVLYLDREEYEKNDKILLCDDISPTAAKLEVKCLAHNMPSEKSDKFSNPQIAMPTIVVNNDTVDISLCQTKYYSYLIKRKRNGKTDVIYDGKWCEHVYDTPSEGAYEYCVIPYYSDGKITYRGKQYDLPRVIISSKTQKVPDIVYKDWFNE